jgi:putative NIF3 family GTP cyclohydrolase 1 type 2
VGEQLAPTRQKIHYVAPGHYNTERFGVQARGRLIAERFDLDVEYVEVPNPY